MNRAWRYRLYPSKIQEKELHNYLYACKNLWNTLLEYTKRHHERTGRFPSRSQLHLLTKESPIFSQVAQNVDERLSKSLRDMIARRRAGKKAGFPRFKPIERVASFTYPQFGFKLGQKLVLSGIGNIAIRKHRDIEGKIKTLTIKRFPSGKWYAIFTSELDKTNPKKTRKSAVGIDLGIETFAYLSDGSFIENPRHLRQAERKLAKMHTQLSKKTRGSKNRIKAKIKVAVAYEKLTNRRRDFLHKISRKLTGAYSLIALEDLKIGSMSRGILAKQILDCSWAEFSSMLHYKAEGAGSEIVLVDPAHTTQECSGCGLMQKKTLAERWHECSCGASMHRDLNAAKNILNRATGGTPGGQAWPRRIRYPFGQDSSMKQEAHTFRCG